MKLLYVLAFITITFPVHAYLDGGSSSMLLQLLLGGVAGGLFVIKIYWKKFISFFKKFFKKD